MNDYGFEQLIETVLHGLGAVDTKIVSRRKDKGIDIYATFLVAGAFRQIVGIQAKHFQAESPVGADAHNLPEDTRDPRNLYVSGKD